MCWCQSVRVNCGHWQKGQMAEAIFRPELSLREIVPARILCLQQWMHLTMMNQTPLLAFLIDCHRNSIPILCSTCESFWHSPVPQSCWISTGVTSYLPCPARCGSWCTMRCCGHISPLPNGSWHPLSLIPGMHNRLGRARRRNLLVLSKRAVISIGHAYGSAFRAPFAS